MERISVKFDVNRICRQLLINLLDEKGLGYAISDNGDVVFDEPLNEENLLLLEETFNENGITFHHNTNIDLVQRIRETINSLIDGDELKRYNLSTLLSQRLNYSYAHLSNTFSNEAYTSIESFLILSKIEKVKNLLISEKLSLTEIAHRLDYSSVAHLSAQFKKNTGLTPSMFIKFVEQRRKVNSLY